MMILFNVLLPRCPPDPENEVIVIQVITELGREVWIFRIIVLPLL